MTYFKLDIPKLNDQISRYKQSKKDCFDDIGIVYRGLGYTESAWNDSNAYSFIEKNKMDKYKLTEYFSHLDNLYNEIGEFKTNIDSICHKYGYRSNSITLKFDDSEINECKKNLNNAINYLNICLNNININLFKPDFKYLSLVYTLRSEIKTIKTQINNLLSDINNFTNSINNEISNSKFRIKRIGNFNFDIKIPEYKWKTQFMQANYIKSQNGNEYSSVPTQNIRFKTNYENINLVNDHKVASINSIDLKDTESNDSYIDNNTAYINVENNINFKQNQENSIDVMVDKIPKENTIDLKSSMTNDSLNINAENYFPNQHSLNKINLTENQSPDFDVSKYEYKNFNDSKIDYHVGTSKIDVDNFSNNIIEKRIDTSNIVSNQFNSNEVPKYDYVNTSRINIDNN